MDFNEEKSIEDKDLLQDMARKIKCGSPVHKINFSIDDRAIIGMYLMTMDNIEEKIHDFVDMEGINDNTLLVFEYKHVVECCQVLYGVFEATKINNYTAIINKILEEFLTRPFFYYDFESKIYNIFSDYELFMDDKLKKVFDTIVNYIWFIPYGTLDELSREGLEEFQNRVFGNGENNK